MFLKAVLIAATPAPAPAGAEAVERADDEGVLKEAESAGGGPLPEEAADRVLAAVDAHCGG